MFSAAGYKGARRRRVEFPVIYSSIDRIGVYFAVRDGSLPHPQSLHRVIGSQRTNDGLLEDVVTARSCREKLQVLEAASATRGSRAEQSALPR